MAEKGGDEESLLANYAVPSRASSSYTIEPGRETLAGSRSSSSESLGSRRESTNSLFSRRPSDWGSRYGIGNAFVQLDDAGIYLSSLSITILLSTLATIGIILFALVVTFAILLGQCQKSLPGPGVRVPDPCASFALNGELNNLQGWTLPSECQDFVARYVDSGQYSLDFSLAVDAGRQYLKPIVNEGDGLDMIVLDIDDTCISHVPYYRDHHFGAELFNVTSWHFWVMKASAPPLEPMLSLYTELRALNWSFALITGRSENERDFTEQNLLAAGYEGWAALILRSEENEGVPAVEYKTKERQKLEEKGFRIWSGFGDQWSDLTGSASGSRTFKLPNPMIILTYGKNIHCFGAYPAAIPDMALTKGKELTTNAGEDALEAMNTFIQHLLGVADPAQLKRPAMETTAAELPNLLYWIMVVGYSIRSIEVRYDMELQSYRDSFRKTMQVQLRHWSYLVGAAKIICSSSGGAKETVKTG